MYQLISTYATHKRSMKQKWGLHEKIKVDDLYKAEKIEVCKKMYSDKM